MDGTLWDSAIQVCKAWDIAIAQKGYKRPPITEEQMQSVMGKTMDQIAEILFSWTEGEERKELLEACCQIENAYLREHGGVLYPQIRETMERLAQSGVHRYIVSNCQAGYIEAFLDYYKLHDLIEDFQCFGDNGLQKADNIRIVMERNGLSGEFTAYLGDVQGDCNAAEAAGVHFIHAAYGFGTIDHPVPAIRSFAELPEKMAEVIPSTVMD